MYSLGMGMISHYVLSMHLWRYVFSIALLVSVADLRAALPAMVDGQALPSLAPMLEQAQPAVVNIATKTAVGQQPQFSLFDDPFFRRFFDYPSRPQRRSQQSLGSGVIVDAQNGLILTNHHVIDGAAEVLVTLQDGREFPAKIVGQDPHADVAVISIEAAQLAEIPWGDSDLLRVGDFVAAIGNPFGLAHTVTSGIVSGLGRSGLGIERYENFIQTDASINPGNSGGALVNLRGQLIGINTAILGSGGNIGIGFAIPANMARDIMQQLVAHGRVRRGRIGVSAQDLTPELARALGLTRAHGVLINQVQIGSAAEHAGMLPGDVVISIGDTMVNDAAQLRNAIGLLPIGEPVAVKIIRDGRARVLEVMLQAQTPQAFPGGQLSRHLEGAALADAELDQGRGVVITEVEEGTRAWSAGLRTNDVIVSANRRTVASMSDLQTAIDSARAPLMLNLQRGRQALFVLLQ